MKKQSVLTGVKIEVSIDCTELLDTGINVLEEFGKLGDEVVFYTDVTVTKDVTDAYTYHMLSEEVRKLKEQMDELHAKLVAEVGDAKAMP